MMCYRDMTFCTGGSPLCAKFKECPRALTETVQKAAEHWWGSPNAPISHYAEPHTLPCYVKPEETK